MNTTLLEKFEKIAVKPPVKRKVNILSAVSGKDINVFIGELVDAAWEIAEQNGQVNDAMLTPAPEVAAVSAAEGK